METPKYIGPYRVDSRLGAGGMGVVYRAHDDRVGRTEAIKCLLPTEDNPNRHQERFGREARILGRLDHPNIVQVRHTLEHEGTLCIVMEYVEGQTLHQRIASHGPLPVGEVVRLGRQIAEGMAAAHKEGIIHRDLKSENVLLDRNGNAKVTDFGVAKVLGDKTLTEKGKAPGTLKAMSPEQLRGQKVTEASDLFSFGILLYEALAGELPFTGSGIQQIVKAIAELQPPSLSTRIPGLPGKLNALVEQLLLKHPSVRPHGFREVIGRMKRIEAALDDETAALTAPSVPAMLSDDESTEDPVLLAGHGAELAHASTPVDARQALVLDPSLGPSRQLAASESSVPVPARVSRWRKRSALMAGASVLLAVLAYVLWPIGSEGGDSGPGPNLIEPAPNQHELESNVSMELPPSSERYIAVLRPEVADDCMHDIPLVRRSIRYEIEQEIGTFPNVQIIPDEDSSPLQREMSLRDRAYALDADELLVTDVKCYPDSLNIELRRIGPSGALLPSSQPFDIDVSDIGLTISTLRGRVRDLYGEIERTEEAPAEMALPSRGDLERFQQLRQDYWQKNSRIPNDELLQELAQIQSRAPNFIELHLFAAEVEEYRYRQDHDRAHLDKAQALLEKVRQLSPASQQKLVLIRLFSVALGRGDTAAAKEIIRDLERYDKGAIWKYLRALLTEKLGDPDGARQLLQQAASRHPSWRILYHQARLAFALGDIAAAHQHLQQLFERFPGNDTGRQLQWEIEVITRPRDAIRLFNLLPSAPSFSVRVNQAVNHMSIGEYSRAIEILEAAHQERPTSLPAFHSLAEAWKIRGESERAAAAFEDMLAIVDERDSGPSDDALRAQLLAHLGRTDEARQSIQRALTEDSRDIRVHYAAAATYALIGEPDLAAQRAIRALDGGYAKEWFHYPWFEAMRESPLIRNRF